MLCARGPAGAHRNRAPLMGMMVRVALLATAGACVRTALPGADAGGGGAAAGRAGGGIREAWFKDSK